MALHVRGVVLPDDEVRDLWLVGDRVTFDAGARRGDRRRRRVRPARAGRRALPHRHRAAAARPIELARRGPGAGPRSTGTPGCWRSATPARRTRTRNSTTTRTLPRLARAGRHVAPPKRYLRDIGVEVGAAEVAGDGGRAGAGRQRLGQAGRRLDRPGRRRPRAGLGRGDDGRRGRGRARRRGPGGGAHVRRGVGGERWCGPGSTRSSTAPGCPRPDIDEMARRGTALVPTMINIATFGGIAAQAAEQVPRVRRPHARAARRLPRGGARRARGRGADLRRHRRRRRHRARAGRRGDAAAARAGRHVHRWTCSPPPPGAPGSGSASPAWSRAAWPTWSSTPRTPARRPARRPRPVPHDPARPRRSADPRERRPAAPARRPRRAEPCETACRRAAPVRAVRRARAPIEDAARNIRMPWHHRCRLDQRDPSVAGTRWPRKVRDPLAAGCGARGAGSGDWAGGGAEEVYGKVGEGRGGLLDRFARGARCG